MLVPPVSLVLAPGHGTTCRGLSATRYRGGPESRAAVQGPNSWAALFAAATARAVADAGTYEQRVTEVQAAWRQRVGRVRSGSAVERLIDALPGAPIITVHSAANLVGRSDQAVNEAVRRLQHAAVLNQTTAGRRNRACEAPELIDAFTELERQLASPQAATLHSPPARRVPHRPS